MPAVRACAAPRGAPRAGKAAKAATRNVRVNGGGEYGASGTSFYTTTEKQEGAGAGEHPSLVYE